MTKPGNLDRRTLLRWLGWLGLLAFSGRRVRASEPDFAEDALGLFRHAESAAALGAEFARLRPAEASIPALLRQLDLPRIPPRRAELARLRERHRLDFREGRVVRLEGWMLSTTELRLCALVHLSGPAVRRATGPRAEPEVDPAPRPTPNGSLH